METTFMSIHNLSEDANILFASESISDILGYQPYEVIGRSCFDYFHPDEVPFARSVHNRGVRLDKAAVLHYGRIRDRNGLWVGCECVFTVVHDVLVACTSVYKENLSSQQRAIDAPTIRRMFSSSPRDPRYHMLEHLSTKFKTAPEAAFHEPRAAIILNRFTRTLTVMYATNAVSTILGVTADQINGKSFYECIQENCLPEAIRCLESAKANDSIAYLRFWYRDPRRPDELDQLDREASGSSDSDDGGVELGNHMIVDHRQGHGLNYQTASGDVQSGSTINQPAMHSNTSSGGSTDHEQDSIFDVAPARPSRGALSSAAPHSARVRLSPMSAGRRTQSPAAPIEIEAVVSCTSDGLVVILRRARPLVPQLRTTVGPYYANGLFAAPWGANPIFPHDLPQMDYALRAGHLHALQAAPENVAIAGGPSMDDFMNSIREVAVFAWSLTGINGNIANYGRGVAVGEAVPRDGFPIWDPHAQGVLYRGPENQALQKWTELHQMASQANFRSNNISPHARQQGLVRRQMGYDSGPFGTDVMGSSARVHLGSYIGDDGRGPGFFSRSSPPTYSGAGFSQGDQQMGGTDNAEPENKEYSPNSGHSGDRYLWY